MAIISTSEFKTFKGISATTWDTLIALLIGAAQAEAERYCGRLFDSASVTETLSGNGSNALFLSRTPITTFTSLSIVNDDGTTSAIDSDDFRYNADTGEVRLLPDVFGRLVIDSFGVIQSDQWRHPYRVNEGFRNVQAVYTGGYTSQTMPLDLKHAMYRYVDAMFQSFKDGGTEKLGIQSESLGDYSYTRGTTSIVGNMFDNFKLLFRPYRGVYL